MLELFGKALYVAWHYVSLAGSVYKHWHSLASREWRGRLLASCHALAELQSMLLRATTIMMKAGAENEPKNRELDWRIKKATIELIRSI